MANVYLVEQQIFNSVEGEYDKAIDCNTDYSCRITKVLSSRIKAHDLLDRRVARRSFSGYELITDARHREGRSLRTVILRDTDEDFMKYGYYSYRVLNILPMEVE